MKLGDRRLFWWFLGLSLWGLFTISLATWWYIFVLREIQRESLITASSPAEFTRKITMIKYEGLAMVGSLLTMVAATGTLLYRELARARAIRKFFLTFTHEIKTPIASIRLQAESLADELISAGETTNRYLNRLIADTERLELQLENSQLLGRLDSAKDVHFEEIQVNEIIRQASREFPELEISCNFEEGVIQADRRALLTILRNLFHNALLHGKATRLSCKLIYMGHNAKLSIVDNGLGLPKNCGDLRKLGTLFYRPNGGGGNGIGLYLCKALMHRMHGSLKISHGETPAGFNIDLLFKGDFGQNTTG